VKYALLYYYYFYFQIPGLPSSLKLLNDVITDYSLHHGTRIAHAFNLIIVQQDATVFSLILVINQFGAQIRVL